MTFREKFCLKEERILIKNLWDLRCRIHMAYNDNNLHEEHERFFNKLLKRSSYKNFDFVHFGSYSTYRYGKLSNQFEIHGVVYSFHEFGRLFKSRTTSVENELPLKVLTHPALSKYVLHTREGVIIWSLYFNI